MENPNKGDALVTEIGWTKNSITSQAQTSSIIFPFITQSFCHDKAEIPRYLTVLCKEHARWL